MILASQTCFFVQAGKSALGQAKSVCWHAKKVWDDVGNGAQLGTPLQTKGEEAGGVHHAQVEMHHSIKRCQAESEIKKNERVAETVLKGSLNGLIFKEQFRVERQLEPEELKIISCTFGLIFMLGLFRVEDLFNF